MHKASVFVQLQTVKMFNMVNPVHYLCVLLLCCLLKRSFWGASACGHSNLSSSTLDTDTHTHTLKYQQIHTDIETTVINVCGTDKHTITLMLSSLEDTQSHSVWRLTKHTFTQTCGAVAGCFRPRAKSRNKDNRINRRGKNECVCV